jgi:drug/metabolite transporter (DMT)-like permease
MTTQRHHWFKAKKYGYGWTPATREGWAALAVALILFTIFLVLAMVSSENAVVFTVFMVLAFIPIAILIYVSWRTGEKPRWRWGGD